jgi:hypothetical protein
VRSAGWVLSTSEAKQLSAELRAAAVPPANSGVPGLILPPSTNANATLAANCHATARAVINMSNGYVPLLFIDNKDVVVPLASRDGSSSVRLSPVQLRLVRIQSTAVGGAGHGAATSSATWRLQQSGINMDTYSWRRHCGDRNFCMDGCRRTGKRRRWLSVAASDV